ncbi:MAG: DUF3140 domain-containing protein [Vulcanimicrobiaceae bacterium]
MAVDSDDEIVGTFHDLVNMTPKALQAWLATAESREVGAKTRDGAESTGHRSGRALVTLLEKKGGYDADDRREMHRIVGYIKRHLAQRPKSADVEHTRWTYSLKNWGHDPAKA